MNWRRLSLLPLFCLAGWAWALEKAPYDEAAFARAQAEGRVTVLMFHTAWCPVCLMQERTLDNLKNDKAYDQVRVYVVDFLRERALSEKYKVNAFSTLIVFRGQEEKARAVGESRSEAIRALLAKAL